MKDSDAKKERMEAMRYKMLMDRLKSNTDSVEYCEAPILNGDMVRIIDITKTKSKSDAIQFAIKFTIEELGKRNLEQKLEKLRYARKETHDSSNDLLDTSIDNKNYPGKLKC